MGNLDIPGVIIPYNKTSINGGMDCISNKSTLKFYKWLYSNVHRKKFDARSSDMLSILL